MIEIFFYNEGTDGACLYFSMGLYLNVWHKHLNRADIFSTNDFTFILIMSSNHAKLLQIIIAFK